jgi:outer membrane protein OmpA-like peptidoglycan-associated protein
MIDAALAEVAALHGVGAVRDAVVLAERVSPFPFEARIAAGRVTLSGGVPDEPAHATIVALAAPADDRLRLLSGAPSRPAWQAAVAFGLEQLGRLDEGQLTLHDLKLSLTGRAKSPAAYDALTLAAAAAPAGTSLGAWRIEPALAAPYTFHATFDGQRLAVSGYTPTEAFAEGLQTGGIGGLPVATSLVLASGAPAGFEANARLLLENLVLLESGSADISDSTVTLDGLPPDAATADAVRVALDAMAGTTALAPPRIAAYAFTATRADGAIVLEGYVPDMGLRERLASLPAVDAGRLELARGQPERFDSAVDFGLELLQLMSDGRFVLSDTLLSISGRAKTLADFTAAEALLAGGAPQGLSLAGAELRPPLAAPFTWAAKQDRQGSVRLSGFVPDRQLRSELQALLPGLVEDTTSIADGAPPNFGAEAKAALALLPELRSGAIDYDGRRWLLSGGVDSPAAAAEVEHAFERLRAAGWTLALDVPRPPPLPIIDPYVWRAQKAPGGAVTLGGFVPSEELRQNLVQRAGAGASDGTNLGAGQPEGFGEGALRGLDALQRLKEGMLSFDGRTWSLSGQVATNAERLALEAALAAGADTASWQVAIQALDAAPVVSPYRWAATKTTDGTIALTGYVASAELQQFIALRAGAQAEDATAIASGEPVGFAADVLAGLEALSHLATGSAVFADGVWTLAGTPPSAAAGALAIEAVAAASSGGPGWQQRLDAPLEPEPVVAALEPAAEADPPAAEAGGDTDAEAVAGAGAEAVEPDAATPAPAEAAGAAEVADVQPAAPAATEPTEPVASEAAAAAGAAEVADASTPAAPVAEAAAESAPFVFSAQKPLGGAMALAGVVPAEATGGYLAGLAGAGATSTLAVDSALPGNFIPMAAAGIRLLAGVEAGSFGLAGDTWRLDAEVASEAERQAVAARVAATPAAAGWRTAITLLAPTTLCRQHVTTFAGRNVILFESGSARLADASLPAIDELAGYLEECPGTTVHVEGHTDADGDDALNLALSVARAETVVEALVARGVGYQRLYAVGYGESLPVADNGTAAGKRANRRIGFTIVDPAE